MSTTTLPLIAARSSVRDWAGLAILSATVFMSAVDSSSLSLALPALSTGLHTTPAALLWIMNAYPIALAGMLVPMGVAGDRFGRRRLLMVGAGGVAVFGLASALAPTAFVLIATRALMGCFGAALMPATLAIIRNTFVRSVERRRALSIWSAAWAVGAACGPLIGGLVQASLGWRITLMMSLPFALIVIVGAPFLVRESRNARAHAIDPLGIILSLGAVVPAVALIMNVAQGRLGGFELLLAALSAASAVGFVRRQRSHEMLDLSLFRSPGFSVAVGVNVLSAFAFMGFVFVISQHVQMVLGKSAVVASHVLVPGMVVMCVSSLAVVAASKRFGAVRVMCASMVLLGAGYVLMGQAVASHTLWMLTAVFVLIALAVGPLETLCNDVMIGSVPAERSGAATGVSETAYQIGSVFGTALIGSLIGAVYQWTVVVPGGLSYQAAGAVSAGLVPAADAAAGAHAPGVASSIVAASGAAFTQASMWCLSGVGVLVLVGAAIVWSMRRKLDAVR